MDLIFGPFVQTALSPLIISPKIELSGQNRGRTIQFPDPKAVQVLYWSGSFRPDLEWSGNQMPRLL
jgi:hypothetical protein